MTRIRILKAKLEITNMDLANYSQCLFGIVLRSTLNLSSHIALVNLFDNKRLEPQNFFPEAIIGMEKFQQEFFFYFLKNTSYYKKKKKKLKNYIYCDIFYN